MVRGFFYALWWLVAMYTLICALNYLQWVPAFWLFDLLPPWAPFAFIGLLLGIWYSAKTTIHRWQVIFTLPIAVLLIWLTAAQWGTKKRVNVTGTSYRVVSLNVHQFQYTQEEHQPVFSWINSLNPDIILLQEFGITKRWQQSDSILSEMRSIANMPYGHFQKNDENVFGLLILSRFPINKSIDVSPAPFAIMNHVVMYTLEFPYKQEVQLLHFHLFSNNLTAAPIQEALLFLKNAHLNREVQIQQISETLQQFTPKEKVLMIGDANVLPLSQSYLKLKGRLSDAAYCAKGMCNYTHEFLPIRIDYAFYSAEHFYGQLHTVHSGVSDHMALIFDIYTRE
jgi:endonuclease/exonuclease/phosphatase (EEP) superfamily protein YafD